MGSWSNSCFKVPVGNYLTHSAFHFPNEVFAFMAHVHVNGQAKHALCMQARTCMLEYANMAPSHICHIRPLHLYST